MPQTFPTRPTPPETDTGPFFTPVGVGLRPNLRLRHVHRQGHPRLARRHEGPDPARHRHPRPLPSLQEQPPALRRLQEGRPPDLRRVLGNRPRRVANSQGARRRDPPRRTGSVREHVPRRTHVRADQDLAQVAQEGTRQPQEVTIE